MTRALPALAFSALLLAAAPAAAREPEEVFDQVDEVTEPRVRSAEARASELERRLRPRYARAFLEAQEAFARLRREADLDATLSGRESGPAQARFWDTLLAAAPDTFGQGEFEWDLYLLLVDELREGLGDRLAAPHRARAVAVSDLLQRTYELRRFPRLVWKAIPSRDGRWQGRIGRDDLLAAAAEIGEPLPTALLGDIEAAQLSARVYRSFNGLNFNQSRLRILRMSDLDAVLAKLEEPARAAGLDISRAVSKMRRCIELKTDCGLVPSDIVNTHAARRKALEAFGARLERLPTPR